LEKFKVQGFIRGRTAHHDAMMTAGAAARRLPILAEFPVAPMAQARRFCRGCFLVGVLVC
jgi:hypothetical protein